MTANDSREIDFIATGGSGHGQAVFTGQALPAFATLRGAALLLAPENRDSGHYAFSIVANEGGESDASAFTLDVARRNVPPQLNGAITVGDTSASPPVTAFPQYACPGPSCTVFATPIVAVSACDPDGDPLTVQVEVVPMGQAFTRHATVSATVPARRCTAPTSFSEFLLSTELGALSAGQTYSVSVRVVDPDGAIWQRPAGVTAEDIPNGGWVDYSPAFQQGPCAGGTCACIANQPSQTEPLPGYGCRRNEECCSGHCEGDPAGGLPDNFLGVCEP